MIAVAMSCAVAAVLLGMNAPAARGLRTRLAEGQARTQRRTRGLLHGMVAVVAGAAVLAAGWTAAGPQGAVLSLAGQLVIAVVVWLLRQRGGTRRARQSQVDVSQACQVLASHLRVGLVPTEALAMAAIDCPLLTRARQVHDVGGDVTTVWREQSVVPGAGGLLELARAWQVSVQTGAPLSGTLEQVASSLTAEESLRAVVAGELASPRATSKVMAALPACGIVMGYLLGGDPIHWLLAGPAGWACVIGGIVLAGSGVIWIELLASQAAAQG